MPDPTADTQASPPPAGKKNPLPPVQTTPAGESTRTVPADQSATQGAVQGGAIPASPGESATRDAALGAVQGGGAIPASPGESATQDAVQSSATPASAGESPTQSTAQDQAPPPFPTTGENAGFRLAAFGALLIVVLFAGYGLGRLNNGTTASPAAPTATTAPVTSATVVDESQPHMHGATAPGAGAAAGAAVGGLSLSSSGLTLAPESTTFPAGTTQRLDFTIHGPGGAPVTTYAVVHDKPLHLIVIRRDLTGFQHLHPVMAPDGTWSADLTLAEPGSYRMVADFTALVGGGQVATTLGSDLTVAGDYAPVTLPDPARVATTQGHSVGYEGTPGTESTQPLLMTVTDASGKPAAVEPYLGAFGHLVVLRQGDLAYVHVHPETRLVDGKVKFWMAAPSPGTYRMFFDFQVAGKVSTAAWTVVVS